MIDSLYEASSAGAEIDLIVRTRCSVRPGVPGLSENIRVRSIVGRYLEHSRIFAFGRAGEEPVEYYIGSADLMERNLDGRIEALVHIENTDVQARLQEILDVDLSDDELAWELDAAGRWEIRAKTAGVNAQRRFQELAIERARRPDAPDVAIP